MEIEKFIENYREAFGEAAGLPVVFWYSDEETGHTEKIGGCFFKGMQEVRAGNTISLNAEVIGCGGGKFYTCLLYTSPSPRDKRQSRMPSSA